MKHIYIILFFLLIASCGNNKTESATDIETIQRDETVSISEVQFTSENMELGQLSMQELNETVSVTGYIDVPPSNKASVTTFMSGYVKNTPLLVGDKVRKGQLVATLENPEFVELQQDYLESFQKLNYLRSEFERQAKLLEENITSQKNYLKSESDYKSNLAHYNGLKQKLQMLDIDPKSVEEGHISSTINLYAPIKGSVTKVNVSNGTFVSPSTEILEIINTDHIHLELMVFEKDILKIKKEQPIKFKVPEASKETYNADVHLVGTSVDPVNRTIKVHGHIEDDGKTSFATGMFVEAQIIINMAKSMALSKASIVEIEGNHYALVLKSKENETYNFEKVQVTIGKQNEAFIEVKNVDTFKEKQVLIKGAFMILD